MTAVLMLLACAGPLQAGQAGQPPSPPTSAALVVYNPADSHHYQCVQVPHNLTWREAMEAATKRTYMGARGRLATVDNEAKYRFLTTQLFPNELWVGGYQDPRVASYKSGPIHGWLWVTGLPVTYTKWDENYKDAGTDTPLVMSIWRGTSCLTGHKPDSRLAGYVVEYPTTGADPERPTPTAALQISQMVARTVRHYRALRSYSATVEFTLKLHIETIDSYKGELLVQFPSRFRFEARGESGRLLAISDGQLLLLAVTPSFDRMHYTISPMRGLARALYDAYGLLTSGPKPPLIEQFMDGSMNTQLWTSVGQVGAHVDDSPPAQQIVTAAKVHYGGETSDGMLEFRSELDGPRVTRSAASFRYKLYPFALTQTHTNIKINPAVPPDAFIWSAPAGAVPVHDLGASEEIEYSAPPKPRKQ